MSSNGEEPASTAQSYTTFWMAGPGSPTTPIVGNPVANPVTAAELASLGNSGVSASSTIQQSDLTTMANAVPHDDFSGSGLTGSSLHGSDLGNTLPDDGMGSSSITVTGTTLVATTADGITEQTLVTVVETTDALLASEQHSQAQQIHVRLADPVEHQHHHQQHQQQHQQQQQQQHQQQQQQQLPQQQQHHSQSQKQQQQSIPEQKYYPIISKTEIVVEPMQTVLPTSISVPASTSSKAGSSISKKKTAGKSSGNIEKQVPQRRRLSASHREMIIDLVFNEKKTSREVARYMELPQSTVMSVVQVFKKEHRIHKKTATGRKRRLTTEQEFQLFEMSQERDNVSVDEIRTRFLQVYPHFEHISKTTIYRTLERGKKGMIGMEAPSERFLEPIDRYLGPKKPKPKAVGSGVMEPSVSILEDSLPIEASTERDAAKQRRSLSIAEREMIIGLFFNENRTIREVADFLHLAKSTVSSVVQVFRKEHRIQRKTSTGRKKKLSDAHEQRIMDILSEKDDITIEETRNKFLMLNPEVENISKSTIYRIMENCQVKMKARPDMEVFVGALVHATEASPLLVMPEMVLGVISGKIEFVESVEELDQLKAEYCFTDGNTCYLTGSQFLMPGFVDTHTHACQFPNNGLALDLPLQEWLQTYTFPTEANFSDIAFARDVYTKVVDRLLRNGTTTAAYNATIHLEATKMLAEVLHSRGQRALVGKVNMLRNCPEYYREVSLQESLAETEDFIRYVRGLQPSLVYPAVTPRFAPTCPEEQLSGLAELAIKFDCHVQTHLCETRSEANWVRELFPWAKTYTEVYDTMRLLGEKSILSHAVWLNDSELQTLAERGCGISHCPGSNLAQRSGMCDARALLDRGIKVGLGTDCSGGSSSSMLCTLRCCVHVSNALAIQRATNSTGVYRPISHKEAFSMATLGGAKALSLDDKIGNFEIDKEFDALLVDVQARNSSIDIFPQDTLEMKVEKFLCNGDDRNITRVYVAGKRVLDNGTTTSPTAAAAAALTTVISATSIANTS